MEKTLHLAFFCWLLLAVNPAHALEAVVVIDHFPPWKIVTEKGVYGIDIELTRALFAEAGITARFEVYPWSRCLSMLENGEADFVSGILKSSDRKSFLSFIEPPYKTHSSKIFYRLAESEDITNFKDLTLLRIGSKLGARYNPRFDEARQLRKQPVNTDELNFRKLIQKRIDTVIVTESLGDYLISKLDLKGKVVKSTYRYDSTIPVYFAVARKSPLMDKLPELSAAAKKLKEDGTFGTIISHFLNALMEKP